MKEESKLIAKGGKGVQRGTGFSLLGSHGPKSSFGSYD
jgi:hypothetical protein